MRSGDQRPTSSAVTVMCELDVAKNPPGSNTRTSPSVRRCPMVMSIRSRLTDNTIAGASHCNSPGIAHCDVLPHRVGPVIAIDVTSPCWPRSSSPVARARHRFSPRGSGPAHRRFSVAITTNGVGTEWVSPSTVTLPSSITSSSADWVREWAVTIARLSIAKHVVLAANSSGKVKTVFQTIGLAGFVLPFDSFPAGWMHTVGMGLWWLAGAFLAASVWLTVSSGIEFARDAAHQRREAKYGAAS